MNEHPDEEGYISYAAISPHPLRRSKRLIQHNQKNIVSCRSKRLIPHNQKNIVSNFFSKRTKSKVLSKNRDQKNIVSKVLPKNSVPPFPPKVIDVLRSISTHSSNRSDSLDSPHVTNAKSPKKSTVVIDPTINQTHLQSILTHLKFGCKNMKNIIHMAQHGSLLHLPENLKYLQHLCPICKKRKMPRLSRNPKLPLSKLTPGQILQMDFAFMNTQSVRGFTFVCVSIKYCIKFCTRYKRAPVYIIKWVLNTLKSQNKTTNYIRFDKGGELTRSYEVNNLLLEEFGIIMQSTGGNASNLNGIVEKGHRTDGNVIRASLYAADLPDSF